MGCLRAGLAVAVLAVLSSHSAIDAQPRLPDDQGDDGYYDDGYGDDGLQGYDHQAFDGFTDADGYEAAHGTGGGELQPDGGYTDDDDDGNVNAGGLRVLNVRLTPAKVRLTATANGRVSVEVTLTDALSLEDTLEVIFYGPAETDVLELLFDEGPTKTQAGLLYRQAMLVPQWATANGAWELTYFAVSNSFTGKIQYYDAGSGSAGWDSVGFEVEGALVDTGHPKLIDLQFPTPPTVINMSCPAAVALPKEPWTCVDTNVTILVDEELSSLANLEGGRPLTGSHIQFKSRTSPSPQIVTLHFDDAHVLPGSAALAGHPESTRAYGVRLMLPVFAWDGQWELWSVTIVDKAGNAVRLSTQDVEGMGLPTLMLVRNVNNLTYLGDDIYHYHDAKAYEAEDDYAEDDYEDEGGYY